MISLREGLLKCIRREKFIFVFIFMFIFFSYRRCVYYPCLGVRTDMLSREREVKNDLVKWIEDHRPQNTKKSYNTYTNQYLKYVESSGLPLKSEVTLASFMKASFDRGLSRQTVTKTVPAAVASLFRFEGGEKISDSELVRQAKQVVERNTSKSEQKLPLQLSQLEDIAKRVSGSFEEVRNYFLMLLMTLGMLRESEAVNLEYTNVTVDMLKGEEYLTVLVVMSKTDQLSMGHTVLLAKGKNMWLCPLSWFKIYCGCRSKAEKFLFHSVPNKKGEVNKLANTTPCFIVKAALAKIGANPELYGSHSCRRGGVTAAVEAEVDMLLIARHGTWKSTAVYLYVADSVERKLLVSRALTGV